MIKYTYIRLPQQEIQELQIFLKAEDAPMIKTISFFAFFFASFTSLAAIALFLLINKIRSGQIRRGNPLLYLVITAAVMGMFYLAEFYYFERNANDTGWAGLERMADILLYMLIAFFWFRFLRQELRLSGNPLLGRVTDSLIIGLTVLVMPIYGLLMDEHYQVAHEAWRRFASLCQILLILTMLILACVYIRVVCLRMKQEKTRSCILGVTVLQALNGAWNGCFVLQMLNNITIGTGVMQFSDYDCSSLLLLGMNGLITLYIYKTDFSHAVSPERNEEDRQRQIQQEIEKYHLTEREQQVANLLLQGSSYEQIAEELFISKYTVKRHAHNLYQKTGVSAKVDLIKKFQ